MLVLLRANGWEGRLPWGKLFATDRNGLPAKHRDQRWAPEAAFLLTKGMIDVEIWFVQERGACPGFYVATPKSSV